MLRRLETSRLKTPAGDKKQAGNAYQGFVRMLAGVPDGHVLCSFGGKALESAPHAAAAAADCQLAYSLSRSPAAAVSCRHATLAQ